MLCRQTQALAKRGNLERHHNANHPTFKDSYPPNSAIRSKKVAELKLELKAQQSLFTKPAVRHKAATEASFRVSHLLAKHKKPFTDGELIKQAMDIIADTVCNDFKKKDDIKTAFSSVPLGPATVTRRVESLSEDVDRQVLRDLSFCEYFSLQLDESLDVMDTAQLVVFVRMVFQDSTTKEDFLTLLHLKDRTRGEDIFNEFKKYVDENCIPIHKLVAITTDGAPAMRGVRSGFIALCRNDPAFPDFLNYHCVIHQQALVGKVVDFSHVMTLVVKLINSIRAKALQHRLFKALLDELDAAYGDLIFHADVRWLSRGKVLQRFVDLLPEIKTFLSTRNEEHKELSDDAWLLDLGFLTDLTAKLNALNTEMQGKNRSLSHMISAVNAFKAKLGFWTTHLNGRRLTHFPNLEKMSQTIKDKDAFQPEQYCAHLDKVATEFNRRFGELDVMEDIAAFVSNPFQPIDVEKIAAKFHQGFALQSGVDMEILDLQNDLELKARSRESDFWGLVSREKFPLLTACALKVSAYFGSTYLCEMAFSQMKIIKSKYRSRLTDRHLTDCLRLAVCSYEPNYKKLTDSIQSQASH
ncbi:general transcription factor II-I repeat domain-containing protein 2A-like [Pimephales promelas]|uniref:general transcription factor II-I repeat domain-containing protein 2A-like n=1 Tax=Pimephales promelas TaxID=90988 RepID=UPI0019557960|nr:general transcription factor II-I repeat domain-containing protein 2A-like [Pimephales promelas]